METKFTPAPWELRLSIFQAIFDPGKVVGMKGERTLCEWQTDAVVKTLATALSSIGETVPMAASERAAMQAAHMRSVKVVGTLSPAIGETEELTRLRAWAFGPDGVKWYTARYAEQEARIEELRKALKWFVSHRKTIETEVLTAHRGRGGGATGWMREDDADFRRDLHQALDEGEAALAFKPLPPTDDAKSEYWLDEVLRRNGPCPTCGTLGMLGSIEDAARQSPPLNMGEGRGFDAAVAAIEAWAAGFTEPSDTAMQLRLTAKDLRRNRDTILAAPSLPEGMVLVPRELTPRLASLIMDLTGCSAAYAEHLWSRLLASPPSSDLIGESEE